MLLGVRRLLEPPLSPSPRAKVVTTRNTAANTTTRKRAAAATMTLKKTKRTRQQRLKVRLTLCAMNLLMILQTQCGRLLSAVRSTDLPRARRSMWTSSRRMIMAITRFATRTSSLAYLFIMKLPRMLMAILTFDQFNSFT